MKIEKKIMATFHFSDGYNFDKNFATMDKAIAACKNFIANCDIQNFGGCRIIDEQADELYSSNFQGEKYFVQHKGFLHEVSEKIFNIAYCIKSHDTFSLAILN